MRVFRSSRPAACVSPRPTVTVGQRLKTYGPIQPLVQAKPSILKRLFCGRG